MSTRAVIARMVGDGWEGVYHHYDGYPTGLGCYIFRAIRYQFGGNAEAFLEYALSHDGGWSHIFPGIVWREGVDLREAFKLPRAPRCYCHGYLFNGPVILSGDGEGIVRGCDCGRVYKNPSCDPLFLEWIYAIDPQRKIMAIFGHVEEAGRYRHRLRGVVALDGPEPDWWAIEGRERRETWVDEYFPPA